MQRKDLTRALVPTCRVFFDEFLKSDFIVQDTGTTYLVTPTYARCERLFGVGEVEEVETRGNIARITIHDSTATLTIYTNRSILGEDLTGNAGHKRTLIAFCGNVHVRESAGKRIKVVLLAEEVGTVEERVRNGWILNTAWRTMERIDALRINLSLLTNEEASSSLSGFKEFQAHYALDTDKLDALASMATTAVTRVWLQYHTRAKELIVELLKKAGKNGVTREHLVSTLKKEGFKEEWVAEVIEELIVDERCYESETGILKTFTSSGNPLLT